MSVSEVSARTREDQRDEGAGGEPARTAQILSGKCVGLSKARKTFGQAIMSASSHRSPGTGWAANGQTASCRSSSVRRTGGSALRPLPPLSRTRHDPRSGRSRKEPLRSRSRHFRVFHFRTAKDASMMQNQTSRHRVMREIVELLIRPGTMLLANLVQPVRKGRLRRGSQRATHQLPPPVR